MSTDIPAVIEPKIIKYAESEHITPSEAILQLIEVGLEARTKQDDRIRTLLGEPMNEQDAALMDEIVEMAMTARGERWSRR